jgi:hypothetical protein
VEGEESMMQKEVTIVSSWFDDKCPQIIAVYDEREAALAWVETQQKEARENPALAYERDHKKWSVRAYEVISK